MREELLRDLAPGCSCVGIDGFILAVPVEFIVREPTGCGRKSIQQILGHYMSVEILTKHCLVEIRVGLVVAVIKIDIDQAVQSLVVGKRVKVVAWGRRGGDAVGRIWPTRAIAIANARCFSNARARGGKGSEEVERNIGVEEIEA